jgi:hypothetical protein
MTFQDRKKKKKKKQTETLSPEAIEFSKEDMSGSINIT